MLFEQVNQLLVEPFKSQIGFENSIGLNAIKVTLYEHTHM
jgi:hypothetical protein